MNAENVVQGRGGGLPQVLDELKTLSNELEAIVAEGEMDDIERLVRMRPRRFAAWRPAYARGCRHAKNPIR